MIQIARSLQDITTGHSIFEKDQVLTHAQLNSIAEYCTDETRLTRVKLLGVGLVCGLRVSLTRNRVTVTRGVGLTTDGDLLYLEADTVFDHYKPYDESAPVYDPFYHEEKMLRVFELVPTGAKDERAISLTRFNADSGANLNDLVAVLFMESYVQDEDLCTGTDCDNLGQNAVHRIKLLLVDKTTTAKLTPAVTTPHQAATALEPLVADRALMAATVNTPATLGAAFRAPCHAMHGKLVAALPKLYPACGAFLGDVFAADPAAGWISTLTNHRTAFASSPNGIQYYYDFLKDVVETWNAFREQLVGERTWCGPDLGAFPKHLLLGNVVATAEADEHRTGFWPSPLASRTAERLAHARFLAQKLDTLIQMFQVPKATTIRITPSRFEDAPLESRAIPYYYRHLARQPVHQHWNFALHQQGRGTDNYSYHAADYGAQGAAAAPLDAQIGAFAFFRIEGHLGQPVATVRAALESEIAAKHLPLLVQVVALGTDRKTIVKPPGRRYTDLHRFHYVLRQDLFHQLEEVKSFSGRFKTEVEAAVNGNVVPNAPPGSATGTVKELALQKHQTINTKADAARTVLNRSYSQYAADTTNWQAAVNDTMKAAGEFKFTLGEAVKTEFATPFDSLIGTTHIQWLDWLDELIKRKDDAEDDQLFFKQFHAQHPGLEHFAGVVRGGTFVLVYDGSQNVVADFMLPYRCCAVVEEEPEEPTLTKPDLKHPWIIDHGIRVQKPRDLLLEDRLTLFDKTVDTKLDFQKGYFNVFKDSIEIMGNVWTNLDRTTGLPTKAGLADLYLDAQVTEMAAVRRQLELLTEKAQDPNVPAATRKQYEEQAKEVEINLARNITATAEYLERENVTVAPNTDGYKAVLAMSDNVTKLSVAKAKTQVKTGLTGVQDRTSNAGYKVALGSMLNR